MRLVSQILQSKGSHTWTISPEATVFDALVILAEKDIGSLVVVENDDVVGIFSERDYSRKVILQGKSSRETLIKEVMTPEVICVRPNQSVSKCMALMTDKRIRHLPVLADGKLAGVISIGDVVKAIISDQQIMINQLEDYIYG
ncbi:MAG: CBS domain-containing protein [Candidatus Promineifilaceae bacterium]|nr:CBS domain-containing protein [Candidatus Promineifilaceae bacterium]